MQGQVRIASVETEVSSPESPFPVRLVSSVIALDWKLLIAALRREGRQNLLVAFLGCALLLNLISSAAELGRFVKTHPVESGSVLTFVAWIVCCTMFAFSFLSGHVAMGRRISGILRMSGRTRMETAWTVVARHLAARQAVVTVVILIPVFSFLSAWMGAAAALPFLAAFFLLSVMSSSAAAVTRDLHPVVRILVWTAFLAFVVSLFVPALRVASTAALSGFPPAWIALLAQPGSTPVAPFALLSVSLTAMMAVETALSMRSETANVHASFTPVAAGRLLMPLLSARDVRLASYGRELVLTLRSSRLLGFWLFGMGLSAALGTRIAPDGPLLPLVALCLLPLVLLSAFFSNLFGSDGAGFQCHWILPIDADDAIAAKERALWTLALAALLAGWSAMFVAGTIPRRAHILLYAASVTVAYALWIAAAGRIVSVLFPRGADPRRISGDYLSPTATFLSGLTSTLFLAIAGGVSILYDRGRIAADALAVIGAVLVLLIVPLYMFLSRASVVLARHRREEILKTVLS